MQGIGIRLYSDEYINYVQAQGSTGTQIMFTDNPDSSVIFPIVIIVTTTVSAFLTSLYTRKIKSSDTANVE